LLWDTSRFEARNERVEPVIEGDFRTVIFDFLEHFREEDGWLG
jgi:hypothetical protein